MSTLEAVLQDLAHAGAPSIIAPGNLAERVLARQRRTARWRRAGAAVALLGTVAGVTAVRNGGGRYFAAYEPSGSMEPTVMTGGSVTADRTLTPVVQDLVVAHLGSGSIIKRVLGVAGDRIACPASIDGRCHRWVRNGQLLSEPYTSYTEGVGDDPFAELTVPPGTLFLLGDHRDNSADSRQNGPLDAAEVVGVVVEIRDPDGTIRAVPGAPPHARPDGVDIDPHLGPPPARSVPVTTPG